MDTFLENYELIARIATFFCLGMWALGTFLILFLQLIKPEPVHGKINFGNPRHIILLSTGLSWLAMWCFRTMY